MELGLQRGTAKVLPHQPEWRAKAAETIGMLKALLGDTAVDIQHVGSTAIPAIHAKPIIDLAVGLRDLRDIQPYIRPLEQAGVCFRGEDVPGQMLFVMGDLEKEFRTHHVHMVQWNSAAWNNYLNYTRCSYARKLLASGRYNVSESAEHSGFSNLSYFAKTYKKYMGELPSQVERKPKK